MIPSSQAKTACIVGIGATTFTRWGGQATRTELDLACEAVEAAAADAGLASCAIDGFSSFANDRTPPQLLHLALGSQHLRLAAMAWHPGGGGVGSAVQLAAMAVETGQCGYAVVYRSIQLDPSRRFGRNLPTRPLANFNGPFGLFAPAASVALIAQRHMHLYGTTEEHLAAVALTCRENAQANPNAVMYGRPLTREEYFRSRTIASPLRLFDCCLECDGACAVIVTTLERARDLRQPPVRILAAGAGSDPGMGYGAFGSHNMPDASYATGNGQSLANDIFNRAGLTPGEIDVVQLYDAFTINVLLALEDYGFVERGASGPFVADGGIAWPNGRFPANTAGGNLSEAYIHGLNHVVEAVRQLRGTSKRQVQCARTCFVGGAGIETPTSAVVLARE